MLPLWQPHSAGDARVTDLLAAAAQVGLRPRSDTELLPMLLELIGAHIPVDAWPTQMGKAQRTEHAREANQARAAAADQPSVGPAAGEDRGPAVRPGSSRRAEAAGWPERARQARQAVDGDRRRRRLDTTPAQPVEPPARLGDALQRRNLFLLPDDQDAELAPPGQPGPRPEAMP